jgi:serine/threonine protein kinase
MKLETICVNCMEDDSGSLTCPKCEAPFQNAVNNPLLLSPRVLLHEQYLIGRALGHGGFGITYLAWDVGLQTRLAVKEYMPSGIAYRADQAKVLPVSEGSKQEYEWGLDRFLEEARVLKKRNHSNVVAVDTVFRDNGTAYLVMEYLEGMTFEEFLRSRGGSVPFEDALRMMQPAMDALSAVHSQEILHRDVSPDNIYITKAGKVKLIDFGSARHALSQKSRKLTVILKAGYTPEEQYRTSGAQGPWTDVYAAGATFYRAITGMVPSGSLDRQAEDTLEAPSRLGVAISAGAEEALMKALAVRAADRFQSMDAFKKGITGGLPVARATPLAPRPETRAAAATVGQFAPLTAANPPAGRPEPDKEHKEPDDRSSLESKIKRHEISSPPAAPAAAAVLPTPPLRKPLVLPPMPKWAPALLGILVLALLGWMGWRFLRKPTPPAPQLETHGEWPAQPTNIPQSDAERQRLLDTQAPEEQNPAPSAPEPLPLPEQQAKAQPAPAAANRQPTAPPPVKAASKPEPVAAPAPAPPPITPPPAPVLSYDEMLKQAQATAKNQQYSQAQTILKAAAQANPAGWKAFNEVAKIELYNLNQPTKAFEDYRAAVAKGGQADFKVSLEHGTGWLTVSTGKAAFKDDVGTHSFVLSDVKEAKKNKTGIVKVGKGHHAFHIRLGGGENYNFEPLSQSPAEEEDFILSIIEP